MNRVSIGSENGLWPIRRQAIILTNAGLLSIGPLGANFSEILIERRNFSFTKMHLKISSAKWRPCCPGGYGLIWCDKGHLIWCDKGQLIWCDKGQLIWCDVVKMYILLQSDKFATRYWHSYGRIRLSVNTASCTYEIRKRPTWYPSVCTDFIRLGFVTINRKKRLTWQQLAVGTDSRSVSTGPSRRFSVYLRKGVTWVIPGSS